MVNNSLKNISFLIILFLSEIAFSQSGKLQSHFIPVWSNNPYLPMNIYISSAVLDSIALKAGDEIGIFDGSVCVGSRIITNIITPGNPLSIIASTDDPLTSVKDGFTPGNKIIIKVWDAENQREIFNCITDYEIGTGNFVSLGSAFLSLSCYSKLKVVPLKFLIEALFDGQKMVTDTVMIELRKHTTPYNLIDSCIALIDSAGNSAAEFSSVSFNDSFYIVIKHRNSIETWSKLPQKFSNAIMQYDFTIDSTMAYGNNLFYKAGRWCIYSGDVNQDGIIDSTDLINVYNSNIAGESGINVNDLNKDELVEIYDLIIVFKNFSNQIITIKPN